MRVLVFSAESEAPLDGAQVQVDDLVPSLTGPDGLASMTLPIGRRYRLSFAPVVEFTAQLDDIEIFKDEITQVIVTLTAQGKIQSKTIEAPLRAPSTSTPTPRPQAVPPDAPVAEATVPHEVPSAEQARASEGENSEAPTQATQPGKVGTVKGTVTAQETKAPVAGTRVYVRGHLIDGQSDALGAFLLQMPSGKHTLAFIHPSYSTATHPGVSVLGGQTTQLQVELGPPSPSDEFLITADAIGGSVGALLDARRESSAASDAIGAEDIARTPAGDAASAAQRIVGVSVVGGRYVYIRGLGERYTNALLNGSPLPSPEPDRATVPLDIFPTQMISAIDVAKTFTPDMPGDFAGGSVRIETVGVPDRFLLSLSLGTGFNTATTFRDQYTYKGGKLDWLGFDDGTRALPTAVPRDHELTVGAQPQDKSDPPLTRPELNQIAPALNSSYALQRKRAMPNVGGSFAIGNGWKFRAGRRLGVIAALNYSRKFQHTDEVRRVFLPSGNAYIDSKLDNNSESIRWGGIGSVAYDFSKRHHVRLVGFRSQLADDQTQVYRGFLENADLNFHNTRQQFASRGLTFGQLRGDHTFQDLNDARLDWSFSLSSAVRSQPDTRDLVYNLSNSTNVWTFFNNSDSGRHFFADQSELAKAGTLDWTQPFSLFGLEHKIKFGGFLNMKDRAFRARRFAFNEFAAGTNKEVLTCGESFHVARCANRLFDDANVVGTPLSIRELTLAPDAYKANLDVYAGYLMADLALHRSVRVIGGARLESTYQRIALVNQFTGEEREDEDVKLRSLDALPSGTIVYNIHDQLQLRASGSRTIARPQLREIAKFAFADYFGGALVSGNPGLELTRITNGDLRLEYFPTPREVLAVSTFVKHFRDPIEPVLQPTGSTPQLTFENARGAVLYGVEFEARKGLGFIHRALRDLTVIGNVTIARSNIEVHQTGADASGQVRFLTNTNRPMVNQAPYVLNLMLDYEGPTATNARLLYNVSGHQLVQVGTQGLDDAYQHPRHSLDFTVSQRIWDGLQFKLTLQNLLNSEYLITQGKARRESRAVVSYRDGVSGAVALSYTY